MSALFKNEDQIYDESYRDDENTSQGGASNNKDSAAEQDHQTGFLERFESRRPEHR